jgi:hypothetical protein
MHGLHAYPVITGGGRREEESANSGRVSCRDTRRGRRFRSQMAGEIWWRLRAVMAVLQRRTPADRFFCPRTGRPVRRPEQGARAIQDAQQRGLLQGFDECGDGFCVVGRQRGDRLFMRYFFGVVALGEKIDDLVLAETCALERGTNLALAIGAMAGGTFCFVGGSAVLCEGRLDCEPKADRRGQQQLCE